MSDALPEPELRDLKRRDRRAFVETMVTAFADDPLFVMLFGPAAREAGEEATSSCRLRAAFVAYLFDMNRLMGGTPRGLLAECRLVGAALLEPPPGGAVMNGLRVLAAALRFAPLLPRLGATRSALLNRYFRGARAAVPYAPHHYLLMIGVRSGAHGRGWGKRLMKDAISRSDRASRSAGIALDTENADNVGWYERWGFERQACFEVGGVVVHSMFRPRQASVPGTDREPLATPTLSTPLPTAEERAGPAEIAARFDTEIVEQVPDAPAGRGRQIGVPT